MTESYFFHPAHEEICKARYFKKVGGEIVENSTDEMFTRVVDHVYQNDKEHRDIMLDMFKNKEFIGGGRTLAQAGVIENLYNCFVLGIGDSREEISDAQKIHFHVQSHGGGTGFNFSHLRPAGSWCEGAKAYSSGPEGFISEFSYKASNIMQGGNRSGANMGILEDWHPSLIHFITFKSERNWENIRKFAHIFDEEEFSNWQWNNPYPWQMFNVSVGLSDKFMRQVVSGSDKAWHQYWGDTQWYLWDYSYNGKTYTVSAPDEETAYYNANKQIPFFNGGKDLKLEEGPYELTASEWFYRICLNAWEDGCPGIFFIDMARKFHNGEYVHPIESTNPCFPADQKILTEDGYVSFGYLALLNEKVKIVQDTRVDYDGPEKDNNNPNYWKVNTRNKGYDIVTPDSPVFMTKKNAPIVKIKTKQGIDLRCTPDHHIATTSGMVRADELQYGHKILVSDAPITNSKVNKDTIDYKVGFLYGLFLGDGHFSDECSRVNIGLWGDDRDSLNDILDIINYVYEHHDNLHGWGDSDDRKVSAYYCNEIEDRNLTNIRSTFLAKLFKDFGLISKDGSKYDLNCGPFCADNYFAGLLSGWIFTDGHIASKDLSKGYSVKITSSRLDLLKKIQQIALNYGAYGKIYENRRTAGMRSMPDGNGGRKEYSCKAVHEIFWSGVSRDNLLSVISLYGKQRSIVSSLSEVDIKPKSHSTATVISVVDDGAEDVYCIKESGRRTLIVNGVVARRCAEQPLPAWSVCCLASLILPTFWNEEKEDLNWDRFREVIHEGIRFLDNVTDLSITGVEQIDRRSRSERRLGLGTTGMADLLILAKKKYSSEEGREFTSRVWKFIRDESYRASIELAKERGSFDVFDFEGYSKSHFFKSLPKSIRDDIEAYGIRNVTLNTQAPVGTTGTMLGYSTGCEPHFALEYTRNSRVGTFKDGCRKYIQWREENPDAEDIPEYFETSHDIDPIDHLKMQAVFSKYIDSSVSKTINLPNDATVEDIENAYKEAFLMGIKSTTVYRDGSKQQILETNNSRTLEQFKHPNDAPVRPRTLPCKIYETKATVNGQTFDWYILVGLLNNNPYELFAMLKNGVSIDFEDGVIRRNRSKCYSLLDSDGNVIVEDIVSKASEKASSVSLECRRFSMELRHGIPIKFIVEQIDKSDELILSFSKCAARILKKFYTERDKELIINKAACLTCGSRSVDMILSEGCEQTTCRDCGNTSAKCG